MNDFLDSLPRMSGELDHVIDLREWEDPEAPAEPLSFDELRQISSELYDRWIGAVNDQAKKQAIQLIAAAARSGREGLNRVQRLQLTSMMHLWRGKLSLQGTEIRLPSVWEKSGGE